MIHYSCDMCKREIDPRDEIRYVVRLEVYAAFESNDHEDQDVGRDQYVEIQEALQLAEDDVNEAVCNDVYQHLKFDLCPECRKQFMRNPLGRRAKQHLDFSKN